MDRSEILKNEVEVHLLHDFPSLSLKRVDDEEGNHFKGL